MNYQTSPRVLFHLLMIMLLFLVLIISSTKAKTCNHQDEEILLRFKNQLSPSIANQTADWDPNSDCCVDWKGILCDQDGRVFSLSVEDFDASGDSLSSIAELAFLTYVQFFGTGVSGPFPTAICNLTSLETLEVVSTDLFGQLPECIGFLSNLTELNILFNKQITGFIPKTFGLLHNLTVLNLQNNNLHGPIPKQLTGLPYLRELQLQNNQLNGSIPASLADNPKLSVINLSNNQLTKEIPDSFGSLKTNGIIFIILRNNQLRGRIPRSLGQLTNLRFFDVSNNSMHGDASFMLEGSKKHSFSISLGYNSEFKFNFSNVNISDQLVGLNISHNKIYGSIPPKLSQVISPFGLFDLSFNRLCGPIPSGRLAQFSPSLFANNTCLCGPPLSTPC